MVLDQAFTLSVPLGLYLQGKERVSLPQARLSG